MYTRHNWGVDEIVTAQKLNNIEDGVSNLYDGGSSFIITAEYDATTQVHTLNKTWKEIHENFINGVHCLIRYLDNYPPLICVKTVFINPGSSNAYVVDTHFGSGSPVSTYTTSSEEGYPSAVTATPK